MQDELELNSTATSHVCYTRLVGVGSLGRGSGEAGRQALCAEADACSAAGRPVAARAPALIG